MELYSRFNEEKYYYVTYPLQCRKHSGKEYFTRSKLESYSLPNGTNNIIFLPDRGIFTEEQEFPTLNIVNSFDVKNDTSILYTSYYKGINKSEIRLVNDSGEDTKIFEVSGNISSIIAFDNSIVVLDRTEGKIWSYSEETLTELPNTESLIRPNCLMKTKEGIVIGDKYHIWLYNSSLQKLVTLHHEEEEKQYHGKGVISMEMNDNTITYLFESDSLYSTREIYQYDMSTKTTSKIITEEKFNKLNIGHDIEGFYIKGDQVVVWTEDQFSEPL